MLTSRSTTFGQSLELRLLLRPTARHRLLLQRQLRLFLRPTPTHRLLLQRHLVRATRCVSAMRADADFIRPHVTVYSCTRNAPSHPLIPAPSISKSVDHARLLWRRLERPDLVLGGLERHRPHRHPWQRLQWHGRPLLSRWFRLHDVFRELGMFALVIFAFHMALRQQPLFQTPDLSLSCRAYHRCCRDRITVKFRGRSHRPPEREALNP